MITEKNYPSVKCRYRKCNNMILKIGRRTYCSKLCRTRDGAIKQYNAKKDDEDFKKKRNQLNKIYYEKNKEALKARMRVYGMEYFFRKRDEARAKIAIAKLKRNEEEKKICEGIIKEGLENG